MSAVSHMALIASFQEKFDFSYVGQTTDATDTATHTFSSVSIGQAKSNRIVIIAYTIRNSGGNVSLAGGGITIGGIAATVVHSSGSNLAAGVAYAVVPTGTTATIVINCAASGQSATIAVYTLYGSVSASAYATSSPAGGADASRSASLNIPDGGCVVSSAASGNISGITWTNATEDFDDVIEGGYGASSASKTVLSAVTPESITANACRAIAAASFR